MQRAGEGGGRGAPLEREEGGWGTPEETWQRRVRMKSKRSDRPPCVDHFVSGSVIREAQR